MLSLSQGGREFAQWHPFVLTFLARRAIMADEQLVRAADRIR